MFEGTFFITCNKSTATCSEFLRRFSLERAGYFEKNEYGTPSFVLADHPILFGDWGKVLTGIGSKSVLS